MTHYEFTPLSDDWLTATGAISSTESLYLFAELLMKAVTFNCDHSFGLYVNTENPCHSKKQYALLADMGEADNGEPGVTPTIIQDVFAPGKQFCFFFDYGNDWCFP